MIWLRRVLGGRSDSLVTFSFFPLLGYLFTDLQTTVWEEGPEKTGNTQIQKSASWEKGAYLPSLPHSMAEGGICTRAREERRRWQGYYQTDASPVSKLFIFWNIDGLAVLPSSLWHHHCCERSWNYRRHMTYQTYNKEDPRSKSGLASNKSLTDGSDMLRKMTVCGKPSRTQLRCPQKRAFACS